MKTHHCADCQAEARQTCRDNAVAVLAGILIGLALVAWLVAATA